MENKQEASTDKVMFKNLSGDDLEPETTEIESLCINCNENYSLVEDRAHSFEELLAKVRHRRRSK